MRDDLRLTRALVANAGPQPMVSIGHLTRADRAWRPSTTKVVPQAQTICSHRHCPGIGYLVAVSVWIFADTILGRDRYGLLCGTAIDPSSRTTGISSGALCFEQALMCEQLVPLGAIIARLGKFTAPTGRFRWSLRAVLVGVGAAEHLVQQVHV